MRRSSSVRGGRSLAASRRAEFGDGVQQAVLRLGRQVAQQAFGAPRGRPGRVEPGGAQCDGPIVAQVDRGHSPVGGGRSAQLGQCAGLEFDDPRLVELIHHGPGWPGQSVRAGIQPRGQDHNLRDARVRRIEEELVVELGTHLGQVDPHLPDQVVGAISPVADRVRRSTPTARTSGSANGSSMSGRSARVAIARAAAAMVAVAPTLDARSQVSPSYLVEVMFRSQPRVLAAPTGPLHRHRP